MTALNHLGLAEARKGLEKKEFTSKEITQVHLKAMETMRHLNAYITPTPEIALKQAEESDKRRAAGKAGALEGLPIAIKDMYCTKGVKTTAASNILGNFVPPYDATITE